MGAWFTETSWPPIMVLAALAAASVAMFLNSQRLKYLVGILPLLIFSPVIYVVEQRIVTERERVEEAVLGITSAFERNNAQEVLDYIAPNNRFLRAEAFLGMEIVEATGPLSVTDVSVAMRNQDSRAISHFRVNGPIRVSRFGDVGHPSSRWDVTWQKQGGDWKITDVRRLDPVSGELMEMLEPSERLTR